MAQGTPASPGPPPSGAAALPAVRLEVRHGAAPAVVYEVTEGSFLIGTVPGSDLRLSAGSLPSVVCLLTRHPAGVTLRRLAPLLPVLVNGKPATVAPLADGDELTFGPVHATVRLEAPKGDAALAVTAPSGPTTGQVESLHRLKQELDARQRQLEEQAQELETDRVLWYRRREEIERECQQLGDTARQPRASADASDLERREVALRQEREALEARAGEAARGEEALAVLKRELADLRQDLYDRYQQRRDRLHAFHAAIRRAGRKLQVRKRQFEDELRQAEARRQEETQRQAELQARADDMGRERQLLDDRCRLLEARQEELQKELADRLTDIQQREQRLAEDRAGLEKSQAQHQVDLVRLDRLQASLDQREKDVEARTRKAEERLETLRRETGELEEQATQMDEWHARLTAEADALKREKEEQDQTAAQLAQRAAALEGQQAMLAALRTRLERMREEVRRDEAQLTELRARHEEADADLRKRLEAAESLRGELDVEKAMREQEGRQFHERQALMETAVVRLREVQDAVARQEAELRQREADLDAVARRQAEEAALLQAQRIQLTEEQQRLDADRRAVGERETALARAEQALATLQEQLRRRSEDLAARQKAQAEAAKQQDEAAAAWEQRRAELERGQAQAADRVAAVRQELEAQGQELARQVDELDRSRAGLAQREEALGRRIERLKESGRAVGRGRKTLAEARASLKADQDRATAALAQARLELDAARNEVADLERQLPDLDHQARAALERLAQAREQLRSYLAEAHEYTRQGRADLEALRRQLQSEAEQIRLREQAVHQGRDEHRLAVAAFRQQLLEWQGHVEDMRRALARDESRLERRRAEVDAQARQAGETTARLAKQAEELRQQERAVAERRSEVERHLEDMRQWYRRKWRELAGVPEQAGEKPHADQAAPAEAGRDILSLTGEIDPADRQLGDLLQSLELVDAETLTALLAEARRQRRSLRQLLLAGGYLTLYQMALIEAGNLDALVLGPLRVIDRLRITPTEAVYRVFDPRRGQEALLRHLGEAEMQDAVRPDEFRQRFAAAAAVRHPHLAATLEVLEIAGRPAALQESLRGVPSTEWPALAGVPGVWYRLAGQAFLGLHTAHQAGLVHGGLNSGAVVATGEGVVKLCGFGEPGWLSDPARDGDGGDAAADVATLGRLVAAWATAAPQRTGKTMPDSLRVVLDRLRAVEPESRYESAAAVLEDLDHAGADVPANAAAWERFLREVREQAADTALRRSA